MDSSLLTKPSTAETANTFVTTSPRMALRACGVRIRFGFRDALPSRYFPSWRKVTMATMLEYYGEMVDFDAKRTPKLTTEVI